MPKLNDLKVKMSVTTTFPTVYAYRDALYVALGERAELERRLEATEAALEEYMNAPPLHVSYEVAGGDPAVHRKVADIIHEWRGVPPGGTSPVTGRVRTGDAEVDRLTGIPDYARKVLERLARELDAKREEVAILHARNEDLTRTMHDVAASKDQEIAHMCEKYNEVRDELSEARVACANKDDDAARAALRYENTILQLKSELLQIKDELALKAGNLTIAMNELDAARANLEAMRAEVVRLQDRLDHPHPATRFISIIGPKDLQGAYERGVEEGRAAAIDEADRIAHALTPGARSVMRERAIQRAKYTHEHDRRHPGEEWLGLMEDATKRHAVRDWPRTFRVIGALAIAALDVLTAEGADWMLKKDMEIKPATDHASSDGSCTPPETDHAAEGLAHQPSPAVPMTVAADDIPTT